MLLSPEKEETDCQFHLVFYSSIATEELRTVNCEPCRSKMKKRNEKEEEEEGKMEYILFSERWKRVKRNAQGGRGKGGEGGLVAVGTQSTVLTVRE